MSIVKIAITKGKETVEVDTDKIGQEMYEAIFAEGLKVMLNAGMSKIVLKDLEGDDLEKARAAAVAKAQENLADIYAGKVKKGRTSKAAGKVPGAVMTEARRIAKALVKDMMKQAGIKISHVEASEITKAANALLDDPENAWIIEKAKAALAERESTKVTADIAALIHTSPKLVEAAEAKKAKAKETLSAKQAGMVKARAKAKPAQHATH